MKTSLPLQCVIISMAFVILGCNNDDDNNQEVTWGDIEDWEERRLTSGGLFDDLRIRHNREEINDKWVLVYMNSDTDTLLLGPFEGHYPLDYEIEYFENDPDNEEDNEWVMEYLGLKGCCVQVYGKQNGQLILKKTYTINDNNCNGTDVDTVAGEKSLYFNSMDGNSRSVLRINFHTGDSIYFGTVTGDIQDIKDIEVVGDKTISIREANDTNYVTIRARDGLILEEIKMPGKFEDAIDDRDSTKIVVTKKDSTLLSRIIIMTDPISAGPELQQPGSLVDLQVHQINNRTYYVVTSYDAATDITYINFIGQNGQGIANHSLKGRFFQAQKRPNDSLKVFVTSEPANNDGSGRANISVYNIETGTSLNHSPLSVGGRPTDLNIDDNGNISVETTDMNGNTLNQGITVN